jgi:5-methylcytosine-specific restriction protein A
MRNPPWSRDEHIVALDFYLRYALSIPGKGSNEIAQLSAELNRLHASISDERYDNFRNPNGVYMKLMNFRRFDPAYTGTGLAHGNKDEEVVWNLYANKPALLSSLAQNIRNLSSTEQAIDSETIAEMGEEEADEGSVMTRIHRIRERNRSLIQKKKDHHFNNNGNLACECCGFDFGKSYGSHGDGFIECHHTKPVSELTPGEKTKISDLALLCSNCHRMIHRRRPWLSIDELRRTLNL